MGPDCGSWGVPNRGTSLRNWINAWGAMHLSHVDAANISISRIPGLILGCQLESDNSASLKIIYYSHFPPPLRITLLCMVIVAKHCYFVLEQPLGSLLFRHRRWEAFCNSTCFVTWRYIVLVSHCGLPGFQILLVLESYMFSGQTVKPQISDHLGAPRPFLDDVAGSPHQQTVGVLVECCLDNGSGHGHPHQEDPGRKDIPETSTLGS